MKIRNGWLPLVSIVASACGSGGSGEVVVLNPGDGLPVETFEGTDIADMNNDGFIDIVSASRWFDGDSASESRLNIFLQDSANPGTFLPRTFTLHGEGADIWDVIAEDMDLDGTPEVLVKSISFDGFALFRQDPANPGMLMSPTRFGSGGFFDPSSSDSFGIGDIDGDLYPDVVVTSKHEAFLIRQDMLNPGEFEAAVGIGDASGSLDITDVDGDGLNDIVTFETHPNNDNIEVRDTWQYLRQDSSVPGTFSIQASEFLDSLGWAIGAADLNGDGLVDVAVSSSRRNNEFLHVYLQTVFSDFSLQPLITTQLNGILGEQAIADLDNDGRPEIIAAMNTGAVEPQLIQIYRQGPGGSYMAAEVLEVPYPPAGQPFLYAVHVADIDQDGLPDILVSADEIFVFFQRSGAPGTWRAPLRVAAQR